MHEITRYQCDFCKKHYSTKYNCKMHENKCFANPVTKSCRTCKKYKTESNTVYVRPVNGENYGDSDYEELYSYCEHYNKKFCISLSIETDFDLKTNCNYYNEGDKNF